MGTLKRFLMLYAHPRYPEKRYIEPYVYCDAKTVRDILFSLFPKYINYMEYYLLEVIVNKFGDEECIQVCQKYLQLFQRSWWLRDYPAAVTDEEIEQSSSQKRAGMSIMDMHITQFVCRLASSRFIYMFCVCR